MNLHGLTDEDLMRALQAGNGDAFAELFDRHKGPLLTFLARFTRDLQKAEDLFQQVFLKVFQNAAGFQGQSSFRTWLFSIAVNAARDLYRHDRVRPSVSLDAHTDPDSGRNSAEPQANEPQPADVVAGRELAQHLEDALAALDEDYRAPFVLARFNAMSYQDIASTLGLTVPTVRMRVHRAQKKLAAWLTAKGAVLSGAPAGGDEDDG